MPDSALPPNLRGKDHWDWPWPFKYIPRGWTAFKWGKPKMIWGNQEEVRAGDAPAPIGEPKSWQVSRFPDAPGPLKYLPLYLAFTLKNGRHVRLGARWDDVDDYVQFPTVASRVYKGGDSQDTSTGPK
jgi:hypothetical protein